MRRAGAVGLAFVLVATACGAGGGSTPPTLSATPWTPERSCGIGDGAERVDAVVDSARLAQQAGALGLDDGGVVLSLAPADDTLYDHHVAETTLGEGDTARLKAAVFDLLRPDRPRARLLVEVADGRPVRIETGGYT